MRAGFGGPLPSPTLSKSTYTEVNMPAHKTMSDRQRFFKNIKIGKDGCWEWQLSRNHGGYGQFVVGSRMDKSARYVLAHRWAYEEFVCEMDPSLQTDHLCRNRACVNPSHLEAVTNQENVDRGLKAKQSKCKYGHPMSGDNLYIRPDGVRRACKECKRRHVNKWYRLNGRAKRRQKSA
jgi:hypothetical protein